MKTPDHLTENQAEQVIKVIANPDYANRFHSGDIHIIYAAIKLVLSKP